jgi:hypothetical protein
MVNVREVNCRTPVYRVNFLQIFSNYILFTLKEKKEDIPLSYFILFTIVERKCYFLHQPKFPIVRYDLIALDMISTIFLVLI